jgi:hypothetical protein
MTTFQKYVQFLRTQFPPGSRVLLTSKGNQESPVDNGAQGTLAKVDSAGRFLVDWDTGQHTALNPEYDTFQLRQPDPMELKLYFPISAEYYSRNQWGELVGDPVELTSSDLTRHLGAIQQALQENQLPEERERGLMHWYRETDPLSWKVKSAFFDVELHDGQLWGVADCQLLDPLEGDELNHLTTYLAGQASDGWGEGFEQQEIHVGRGLLYVHLWDGQNWEMSATEPEQKESPGMGMAP